MKKWRSKSYTVKLSRTTRLSFTLRRFRPKTITRGSRKQLAMNLRLGDLRQVAVSIDRKHSSKVQAVAPSYLQQLRLSASTLLIAGGVMGVGLFGISIASAQTPASQTVQTFSIAAPPTTTKIVPDSPDGMPHSVPTHITIPTVGIDANIMSVGLNADGSMETPSMESPDAGWYRLGPSPGQIGPAVIVGHLDSHTSTSVFWRLREVQPGSLVHITRADGKTATFRVTSLDQYDQNNFPSEKVYGNIAFAGLRLITCGGTFNPTTQRYSENTVVSAELLPEHYLALPPDIIEIGTTLLPKPLTPESIVKTNL